MNKITSFICAFLMALISFSAIAITTSDYVIDEGTLVGDVNNDGHVSSVDITALYNYLLNGDTSNLYFVGTNSNFGVYDEILSVPYIYLGDATGYLAKLTTSNSLSIYPWSRYLFNRLFVKDGTVYVDAFGFYEQDSNYNTYYWSFGKNVFLKFTASAGLQLYTGAVSQNGLSMSGYNYNSSGTLENSAGAIIYDVFLQTSLDD